MAASAPLLPPSLERELDRVAAYYGCTEAEIAIMRVLAAENIVAARSCYRLLARDIALSTP
jgi:hypothetical protein